MKRQCTVLALATITCLAAGSTSAFATLTFSVYGAVRDEGSNHASWNGTLYGLGSPIILQGGLNELTPNTGGGTSGRYIDPNGSMTMLIGAQSMTINNCEIRVNDNISIGGTQPASQVTFLASVSTFNQSSYNFSVEFTGPRGLFTGYSLSNALLANNLSLWTYVKIDVSESLFVAPFQGQVITTDVRSSSVSIPEPACMSLLGFALLSGLRPRRRVL